MRALTTARCVGLGAFVYLALLFALSLPFAGADSVDARNVAFVLSSVVAAGAAGAVAARFARAATVVAVAGPSLVCWLIVATTGDSELARLLAAVLTPLVSSAAASGARRLTPSVARPS